MVVLRCTLSLSTLVALLLMLPSVLATCYYPTGAESQDDTPCPNRESCCPQDAFCLSNGLCWTASNYLLRASCTDKGWTSPDCSRYCTDALPKSAKVMTPCSNYNFSLFACDYDTCYEKNFTVSPGQVLLRDYQQKSLGASETVTANASSSTPTSSSTPSTFPSSPALSSSSNQSPKLAAVGVGVGGPLAVALAAALVLLGRERRNARRLELENARLAGGGGPGMAGGYGKPNAAYQQQMREHAGGVAQLVGDSAVTEVMAQPMAHELQAYRS